MNRHGNTLRSIALLVVVLATLAQGCASEPSQISDQKLGTANEEPRAAVEFVVVALTTPFFLGPDDTAPFFQYRTPDEQAEVTHQRRESALEQTKTLRARFAQEIEREKKRIKRIRDADRKVDYAEKRRIRRARRYFDAIDKRLARTSELPPNSRFVVMKVRQEKDEWVQVETLPADEERQHCYFKGLPGLENFRLKLWVKASELETLITRRVRSGVWRGSEVTLAPGVVVTQNNTVHVAHVDGYKIELDLDLDSTGKTFTRPSRFPRPVTDTRFTTIALAEGKLRLSNKHALSYNPYWDLYVTETMRVGQRFYATTQTPCGKYTIHASEEDLEVGVRRGTTRISGEPPRVGYPRISVGTQIVTPEGHSLGDVVRPAPLPETSFESNSESLICFRTPVWRLPTPPDNVEDRRSLTWCITEGSVEKVAE